MATTDRPDAAHAFDPAALAATIREAELCLLLARADGDALAATGLLASACGAVGTPYHAGTVRTRSELQARLDAADEAATPIVVGADEPDVETVCAAGPTSLLADATARELDVEPDPATALAGAVAAGTTPGNQSSDAYEAADLSRRPGIAGPTGDSFNGLAYTTLAHSEYSGRPGAARGAIEDADVEADPGSEDAHRAIASLLAIAVATNPELSDRAATSVERALRPHVIDEPVATLEGYADVLEALACDDPGLGLALALGSDGVEPAIETWRDHARNAHAAVRDAETTRHPGLLVAEIDGPVETVARLLRDFRSPEPAVIAVADDELAIAGEDADGEAFARAVTETDGNALARGTRGYGRHDTPANAIDAFREAR